MKIKKKSRFNPKIINDDKMKGVKFYPLITPADGAPNFSMRVFEISPGGYTPKHQHKWEHEVYVISGSGYLLYDEGTIEIGKDNCILIKPFELHQFRAGSDGMSMICVVPNEGQPK